MIFFITLPKLDSFRYIGAKNTTFIRINLFSYVKKTKSVIIDNLSRFRTYRTFQVNKILTWKQRIKLPALFSIMAKRAFQNFTYSYYNKTASIYCYW